LRNSAEEPEVSGLAVTRERSIGAYAGVPVHLKDGRLYGALCGLSHDARPDLSERDAELLRFLAGLVGELLEQDSDEQDERRSQVELTGVHALVAALEARDHYTGEHSRTVVRLATTVGERLGLSAEELAEVEQVAILHDVGKVGIPDAVLQKRGPLTPEEWELMRHHPVVGERVVGSTESLAHLGPAVRAEHERFDGTGYPDGLCGEEIPIASRITLACDAYHAMTSDRPYRRALPDAEARRELEANAGTQFDPLVIRTLLEVLEGGADASGSDRPRQSRPGRRHSGRRHHPGIPVWEPRAPRGSGTALGDVRCKCARCGTHGTALVTKSSVSGSCANCGSYEMELLRP
ncbi:MAG TPA: HD domain-containing phosphohydrolase, partial [Thermoleophilaceae bacterium]|nr:HD domain-containing phosphohydrolase [Thermoleophilaceae bacterium]